MLENRTLEVVIIAAVVLLLFGAKRLPDAARGLGKSLRIFKSEVSAMKTDSQATATVQRSVGAGPTEDATDRPVAEPTSIVHS